MAISNSRFSYGDCYDLMDKALADPKGIRIKFSSWGDALHFRLRLHTARRIDRKDNLEVFPADHAMHGKSPYDPLIMRLKATQDNTTWLRLEKVDAREFEVESLAEDSEPELFTHQPKVPYKAPAPVLEIRSVRPRPDVLKRRV
jgi:hypothetical protein